MESSFSGNGQRPDAAASPVGGKGNCKVRYEGDGGFACRKLTVDDLECVMAWRMAPHVTRYMNTDPKLTLQGQIKWFEKISSNGYLYHWIVLVGGVGCGLICVDDPDPVNRRASWGYYIADERLRSFALAVSLEMSLYDYAFDALGLNKLVSECFADNEAAIRLHALCVCKTDGVMREHVQKGGRFFDVCIQSMLADEWRAMRGSRKYQRIEFA